MTTQSPKEVPMISIDNILAHISEKPWSAYIEADYSIEQWHSSCLIHQHQGPPTSKAQCKLPVKTPNGAVNRNGVHAAAAALAGARGGVHASSEEKAAATAALLRLYGQLGEDPPDSLKHTEEVNGFFEHFGVKGQKWGVRRSDGGSTSSRSSSALHDPKTMTAGRRLIDKAKGDRTFWQRSAAIGVVTGAAIAAAALAPAALPASVVLAAGGPALVSTKIALGTGLAIRGAQIQNAMAYNQRYKARIAHADVGDNADGTVLSVYNAMSQSQKDVTAVLAYSFVNRVEMENDQEVQNVWATMSPEQRAVSLFLANVADKSPVTAEHSDIVSDMLEHHGIKGMRWGVRRRVDSSSGLVSRTSSADQIQADRIKSKIQKGGTAAVSNRDLKDFAARINAEQEFNRANATAEAQKGQNFVTKFMKTQGSRQFKRVSDKAIDIAVEKLLEEAGLRVGKKGGNPDVADTLVKISGRLKPKKGK